MMKRTVSILMATVICLCTILCLPAKASAEDGIMPYYTNFYDGKVTLLVYSSGYANVTATVMANSNTTSGTIYTYIQQKYGDSWDTINNGQTNNKWADTFGASGRTVNHYMYLPSKGTYRAVAVFYVSGTGGIADSIVKYSSEATYS